MQLSTDQLMAIIGAQHCEIIAMRMEVERLRQYEPKPAPEPTKLAAVE